MKPISSLTEKNSGLQVVTNMLRTEIGHYSWTRIFRRLFQKGALLGQKTPLNLWYVDTRPNSQKLFPSI